MTSSKDPAPTGGPHTSVTQGDRFTVHRDHEGDPPPVHENRQPRSAQANRVATRATERRDHAGTHARRPAATTWPKRSPATTPTVSEDSVGGGERKRRRQTGRRRSSPRARRRGRREAEGGGEAPATLDEGRGAAEDRRVHWKVRVELGREGGDAA